MSQIDDFLADRLARIRRLDHPECKDVKPIAASVYEALFNDMLFPLPDDPGDRLEEVRERITAWGGWCQEVFALSAGVGDIGDRLFNSAGYCAYFYIWATKTHVLYLAPRTDGLVDPVNDGFVIAKLSDVAAELETLPQV